MEKSSWTDLMTFRKSPDKNSLKLSFSMKRYLGALAPSLDMGPGAGPQDCRGEESLTWRCLHSAQLCCCCCQALAPTPGAKQLQPFFAALSASSPLLGRAFLAAQLIACTNHWLRQKASITVKLCDATEARGAIQPFVRRSHAQESLNAGRDGGVRKGLPPPPSFRECLFLYTVRADLQRSVYLPERDPVPKMIQLF